MLSAGFSLRNLHLWHTSLKRDAHGFNATGFLNYRKKYWSPKLLTADMTGAEAAQIERWGRRGRKVCLRRYRSRQRLNPRKTQTDWRGECCDLLWPECIPPCLLQIRLHFVFLEQTDPRSRRAHSRVSHSRSSLQILGRSSPEIHLPKYWISGVVAPKIFPSGPSSKK